MLRTLRLVDVAETRAVSHVDIIPPEFLHDDSNVKRNAEFPVASFDGIEQRQQRSAPAPAPPNFSSEFESVMHSYGYYKSKAKPYTFELDDDMIENRFSEKQPLKLVVRPSQVDKVQSDVLAFANHPSEGAILFDKSFYENQLRTTARAIFMPPATLTAEAMNHIREFYVYVKLTADQLYALNVLSIAPCIRKHCRILAPRTKHCQVLSGVVVITKFSDKLLHEVNLMGLYGESSTIEMSNFFIAIYTWSMPPTDDHDEREEYVYRDPKVTRMVRAIQSLNFTCDDIRLMKGRVAREIQQKRLRAVDLLIDVTRTLKSYDRFYVVYSQSMTPDLRTTYLRMFRETRKYLTRAMQTVESGSRPDNVDVVQGVQDSLSLLQQFADPIIKGVLETNTDPCDCVIEAIFDDTAETFSGPRPGPQTRQGAKLLKERDARRSRKLAQIAEAAAAKALTPPAAAHFDQRPPSPSPEEKLEEQLREEAERLRQEEQRKAELLRQEEERKAELIREEQERQERVAKHDALMASLALAKKQEEEQAKAQKRAAAEERQKAKELAAAEAARAREAAREARRRR